MDTKLINATYVRQVAAAVDLPLHPDHIAGVTSNLRVIAGHASLVNEFPLDVDTENASIFRPCSVQTPS